MDSHCLFHQSFRSRLRPNVALAALLFALVTPGSPLDAKRPEQTALDRYVKAPDPAYKYTLVASQPAKGYTAHLVEMTSQSWLTPQEVDRTVWTHWLTVIQPETVSHQTALVFVSGGNNGSKPPERPNPLLADIAVTTQSVVAELRMVPNQPVTFTGETKSRREDELIAYSWDKFLRTGDERWPARLPMTKAVVRAMDTVTSFCAEKLQGNQRIDRFVVAGASKRGWTTWTTAAVDSRVVAIVPMVIDLLNLEPSFVHHWRAYGLWAPAIKDYEDMQIMRWANTPQYRALREIEDPYEYRDRLTLPKFLINSAGDQFFLPDSWRFYYDDLRGEKYLRYVPNTDHALRDSDAGESLGAFYATVLAGTPRPSFTWQVSKDGTIRVRTKTKPASVTLWRASAPNARDFRLETIGKAYQSTAMPEPANGEYVARPVKPEKGWTASFIELRFQSGTKYPLVFTTGVSIVPDRLPFDKPQPGPPPTETR
jgi:PhoPQ-activated pathogenicity-related protein